MNPQSSSGLNRKKRKEKKRKHSLGYDLAHSTISHASILMKAVIVDKLGYPTTIYYSISVCHSDT